MAALVLRLVTLLAWVAVVPASADGQVPLLGVDGSAFVLHTGDGHSLRGAELVGAELAIDANMTIRIDGVRADPLDASGEVLLHRFSVRVGDGAWENPCEAAPDGTREAFPIPGRWDANGRYRADHAHFAISCTSGAQAKCVRFGYRPWKQAADGARLASLYEACVHMVRADYCGDGTPATRNGTLIDVYDRHGIQASAEDPELHFEAGWSAQGAVCVARTRIADELDLAALAQRCPRLKNALGTRCDEGRAKSLGALVFNRSR
jgi:hypothetical protein